MAIKKDWFVSWFDTSYYHILYKDRDDTDAQIFMKNITSFLKLPNQTHILDLACGKGRHSVFLNSLGYKVTGVDLSENSISSANLKANDSLNFRVHDMRDSFSEKYDAIFNLFTSFGYFEEDEIDIKVLKNIKEGLSKNGIAVIDFLNVAIVADGFISNEVKTIENIDFHIHKKIENGFIIKEISFEDKGKKHSYFERVKYLDIHKFTAYFEKSKLEIQHVFGDYDLSPYTESSSKRLIFIVS
jgi:SAM-dependent methyltransferase